MAKNNGIASQHGRFTVVRFGPGPRDYYVSDLDGLNRYSDFGIIWRQAVNSAKLSQARTAKRQDPFVGVDELK